MRSSRLVGVVVSVVSIAFIACGDDDDGDEVSMDAGADAAMDAATGGDAGVGGDAGGGDAGAVDAGTADTFTTLYAEVFTPHSCPVCHTGGDHPSMLNLSTRDEAYDGLVDQDAAGEECGDVDVKRVEPGNADHSLLIWKLEGEDHDGNEVCGARMPLGLTPLTEAEIARVRAWIDAGAKDD